MRFLNFGEAEAVASFTISPQLILVKLNFCFELYLNAYIANVFNGLF
jgi:hypothetical protein